VDGDVSRSIGIDQARHAVAEHVADGQSRHADHWGQGGEGRSDPHVEQRPRRALPSRTAILEALPSSLIAAHTRGRGPAADPASDGLAMAGPSTSTRSTTSCLPNTREPSVRRGLTPTTSATRLWPADPIRES
jgi:hypothetical protein